MTVNNPYLLRAFAGVEIIDWGEGIDGDLWALALGRHERTHILLGLGDWSASLVAGSPGVFTSFFLADNSVDVDRVRESPWHVV